MSSKSRRRPSLGPNLLCTSTQKHYQLFFSRPSPKAGRELQTTLDTRIMEGGMRDPQRKIISRSRSQGCESTQRLCTCLLMNTKATQFKYMRSSKGGHRDTNKDRINMHVTASQFQIFFILYSFFYCDYLAGKQPLGKKNL